MELKETYFKLVIIILVTLLLVLPVHFYLKKTSASLSSELSKTLIPISTEDWVASKSSFNKFTSLWISRKGLWASFIDHSEIDKIEDSVVKLEKYIDNSDKSQALPEASLLIKNISHIYEKKQLTVKNIL